MRQKSSCQSTVPPSSSQNKQSIPRFPSEQNAFDPAVVGLLYETLQPIGTEQVAGQLHHNIIGLYAGVIRKARQTLQT